MQCRLAGIFCCAFLSINFCASGQSISSGTVVGAVVDPTKALVAQAHVEILNRVTGYRQTVETDSNGAFRFNNIPFNSYELSAASPGFSMARQAIDVRTTVPISVSIGLQLAGTQEAVTVEAAGELVENDPSAHTDADSGAFSKLPVFDPAAGLSSIINYSTGGTAQDANGFFHPLGDHAQVSYVIDGQNINDQQSKVFSTQLPANAIQSMELITGAPDAQYGDKSSLVVNAVTKSALGATRPFGSIEAYGGSFGTWGENVTFGFGSPKLGNFIAVNGIRTGHFLDTPEFLPIHDIGNNQNIFDRFDYQPNGRDAFHLNLFAARNWFQIPNSYDQLAQDQKQRVLTWNVAPGYQHTFSASTLLTLNAWGRRDQVNYYGSRDPFDDTPVTESQKRFLTNYGMKADVSTVRGRHNLKFGTQLQQTRLLENFALGVTDPAYIPYVSTPPGMHWDCPALPIPTTAALSIRPTGRTLGCCPDWCRTI